jgi:hypothetical protein
MSDNDSLLLDQTLENARLQRDPAQPMSEFFTFYSAMQVLKDFQLSPDEIDAGIVDQEILKTSGTDGGIDSIYLIVNGRMIRDVDQAKALGALTQDIDFDIVCIQSKLRHGFELAPLIRFSDTADCIFDPAKPIESFGEQYNDVLLDIARTFREVHTRILPKRPNTSFRYCLVTRGDTSAIDDNIKGKAGEIEQKIIRNFRTINKCDVEFVGARELFDLAMMREDFEFTLPCFQTMPDECGGALALVQIGEYYKLITDGDQLREFVFESNVRDFQGEVAVNVQIKQTLDRDDDKANFWWLNNGITIVSDKIDIKHHSVKMHDPQIVNGLQTSQVIFNHLRGKQVKTDPRYIVVRVISTEDEEIQDRVIRATNSQTAIPLSALHASDDIQRDIETTFRNRGMHYDRRKNSWKRTGLPISKIVGMTELAQSVGSIVLKEPDHARARPARFFKDQIYQRVFKRSTDLQVYVACAQLRKRMEAYLATVETDKKHRNNLLFYCLMVIGFQLARKHIALKDVDVSVLNDDLFKSALDTVRPVYEQRGTEQEGAYDKAAKGTDMVTDLRAMFSRKTRRQQIGDEI